MNYLDNGAFFCTKNVMLRQKSKYAYSADKIRGKK